MECNMGSQGFTEDKEFIQRDLGYMLEEVLSSLFVKMVRDVDEAVAMALLE
jgi:hypothetical protein